MATEFICTCNKTGEDYGLISDWEAAIGADLTSSAVKVFGHGGITGTVGDGATVTGQTSGATGTVAHATATQIMLTGISGTFQSGEVLQVTAGNSVTIDDAGDSVIAVLELFDDDGKLTEGQVSIGGWTTDATNKIIIRVPDTDYHNGQETDGSAGNGFLFESSVTGTTSAWAISEDYVDIIGLQVKGSGSTQRTAFAPTANTQRIINCIVRDWNTDRGVCRTWQKNSLFINVIVYNIGGSDGDGFQPDGGSGTMTCLHCGAYNCSDGSNARGFNATTCKNCWAFDNDEDYGGSVSLTTSASSDTTGSSGLQSLTASDQFVSVSAGSEDFHLKSGSDLEGAGTDLSAEDDAVDNDVDGDSRTGWDIGFDEFTSSSVDVTPTPGSQSLTLTLNAPTIVAEQNVSPSADSLSVELTLNSPTIVIQQDVTVTPGSQSLGLTLNAPTVDTTGNVTVIPATFTLGLTQNAPGISADCTVVADSQSLTLTQNAPSVSTSGSPTLIPATQSLSLTLNQPTIIIEQDVTVTPSPLSLGLTLNSPGISTSGNITIIPTTFALGLTLNNPNCEVLLIVDPQALGLTQNAPGISADCLVAVDSQALALTLNSPTPDLGGFAPILRGPYIYDHIKQDLSYD